MKIPFKALKVGMQFTGVLPYPELLFRLSDISDDILEHICQYTFKTTDEIASATHRFSYSTLIQFVYCPDKWVLQDSHHNHKGNYSVCCPCYQCAVAECEILREGNREAHCSKFILRELNEQEQKEWVEFKTNHGKINTIDIAKEYVWLE